MRFFVCLVAYSVVGASGRSDLPDYLEQLEERERADDEKMSNESQKILRKVQKLRMSHHSSEMREPASSIAPTYRLYEDQ